MEIRKLVAKDLPVMASILTKIGIKEFKGVIEDAYAGGKGDGAFYGGIVGGLSVALANLEKCQNELFAFIGSLVGKSLEEVEEMPLDELFDIAKALAKSEQFKRFFTTPTK